VSLSLPPNSLILKIVSGTPKQFINARKPGIVPLVLSKYGKLWYKRLYTSLFISSSGIIEAA